MEQLSVSFFIEGKYFGTFPYTPRLHEGKQYPLFSTIYYCGQCGEVFARITLRRASGELISFQAIQTPCKRCRSPFISFCPGSIWIDWEPALIAAMPKELLQLELLHHINQQEKLQNESN